MDHAIDSGADAVGFIFGYGGSPRNISFQKLTELIRRVPPYVSSVVVSPASNPNLERVAKEARPSFFQLYSETPGNGNGALPDDIVPSIVINTVHVSSDMTDIESTIERSRNIAKISRGIILDSPQRKPNGRHSGHTSLTGGSGVPHDWSASRRIRDALFPFPIILGGGLNSQNVRQAISTVRPFAVDVSSGVESMPGIKDKAKVAEFITRVKSSQFDY